MTFNLKNFVKILFAVSIVGISAAQADETKCRYKDDNKTLVGKIIREEGKKRGSYAYQCAPGGDCGNGGGG